MKIYTRTGDKGTTSLIGGSRVSKSCARVNAYGDIDELTAYLGLLLDLSTQHGPLFEDLCAEIAQIQHELFTAASEMATPANTTPPVALDSNAITRLETDIDQLGDVLPRLTNFVLAGGNALNSHFHIARCICRRAERQVALIVDTENSSPTVLRYLNRLSDWLFVAGRIVLFRLNQNDRNWISQAPNNK